MQCKPQFRGFWKTNFWKYYLAKLFFVRNYFYVLYTWHDHWARFWIKEKGYKSWRIYLIFRALANSSKHSIKAKTKNSKVFVKPHFIMIVSLSVVAWKSGCDRHAHRLGTSWHVGPHDRPCSPADRSVKSPHFYYTSSVSVYYMACTSF